MCGNKVPGGIAGWKLGRKGTSGQGMAKLKVRFTFRVEQKRFKIEKSTQRKSFQVNLNERQELDVVTHPMKDVLATKYPWHKNAASSTCQLRHFSTFLTVNWWTAGEQHIAPFTHSMVHPSLLPQWKICFNPEIFPAGKGSRWLRSSLGINLLSCSFPKALLTLHPTTSNQHLPSRLGIQADFCLSCWDRMVKNGSGGLRKQEKHPERLGRGSAASGRCRNRRHEHKGAAKKSWPKFCTALLKGLN